MSVIYRGLAFVGVEMFTFFGGAIILAPGILESQPMTPKIWMIV